MPTLYETLGVQKTDSAETIRTAYRRLAKKHHPDVNAGDPKSAERFKAIASAYDILGDAEKRKRYDAGEIDAAGNERAAPPPPPHGPRGDWQRHAAGAGGERYRGAQSFSMEDLEELFGQGGLGAGFGGQTRGRSNLRGQDAHYTLTVSFTDAANGATRRITLPDGRSLDVNIPAGVEDGTVLRLRGQGEPGFGEAQAGDALVEIAVAAHPDLRREGNTVRLTLPVTLQEAVLGTSLDVPTISGPVRLTIPPGSGQGTMLRLRGKGIKGGHQLVELQVIVPPGDEPELAAFLRGWKPRHPQAPRRPGMEHE
jgi:DnaJ-class molecular chaperone